MAPITKYHCPDVRFKVGDIIWDGYNGNVFRILNIPNDEGLEGAVVEPIQELIIATSRYPKEKQRCFLAGGFWCRAEKYPVAEAKKLAKDLEHRLQMAHVFLEQVCGAEAGVMI